MITVDALELDGINLLSMDPESAKQGKWGDSSEAPRRGIRNRQNQEQDQKDVLPKLEKISFRELFKQEIDEKKA